MATTGNATDELTPNKIRFVQNHRPALKDGDYTITVQQEIEAPEKIDKDNVFTTTRKFSVSGPRFNLNPQDIQAVFPPAGSLGEHSNVLPHIILNRSTLPWERTAEQADKDARNGAGEDAPWLALLLFYEEELKKEDSLQSLAFRDLKNVSRGPIQWPGIPKSERGQHDDDKVSVIDVPYQLLQQIMPKKEDLHWLAHVRQTKADADKPDMDEVAVIIGNRLPKPGSVSIVHLVSIEGRYGGTEFNYQNGSGDDLIRLVSLHSWRFACVSQKQSFKGLLMHFNHPLLFNIQTTPAALGFLKGETLIIPDNLKQAFAQSNHLLPANLSVKDWSGWKISDGGRYYLISKNKVYNQAGKDLDFSLASSETMPPPDSAKLQPVSEKVKTVFKDGHHPLSDKATVVTDADSHWWLGVNNPEYFIYREIDNSTNPALDRLYVYHLDPDRSSTLRLPKPQSSDQDANEAAEKYLKMGCVPLPHAMRQGNKSVSWYHGPLIPGQNKNGGEIPLPVRTSDQLMRYDPTYGMFDVSYAAAWELGRLLTLQNKQVSLDLSNWKRSHIQQQKDAEQQLAHLPFDGPSPDLDLPKTVADWFRNLALLQGVPFNYLVPDETMLPQESIRFFQVDGLWLECLLDGGFSIGRLLSSDHERDQGHQEKLKESQSQGPVSGFLLRSDVVAGWPELLIDGSDVAIQDNQDIPTEHKLTPSRIERLSKNVLLCLFKGVVQTVDIHQKPETLHFGFNPPDDEHGNDYYKELKDLEREPVNILWGDKDKRVINIAGLAQNIKSSSTSAQFAKEMIEGVQRVRFVIDTHQIH